MQKRGVTGNKDAGSMQVNSDMSAQTANSTLYSLTRCKLSKKLLFSTETIADSYTESIADVWGSAF